MRFLAVEPVHQHARTGTEENQAQPVHAVGSAYPEFRVGNGERKPAVNGEVGYQAHEVDDRT